MKQCYTATIFKLFNVLLFTLFFLLTIPSFTMQIFPEDSFNYYQISNVLPEEGFCAGTLVKTPHGYEKIENLFVDDLVIDINNIPNKITAITKRFVNKYVKISLPGTIFYAGHDQLLLSRSDLNWIKICDLPLETEIIAESATIYTLSTESHTFFITSNDICAHNAEALFLGAASICCGSVAVINPIIAVLGSATLSLSVVAYNAYQLYKNQKGSKNVANSHSLPDTVVFAERFYYEERKQALEKMKQELIIIKNGIGAIRGLKDIKNFTYHFLQSHQYNAIQVVQPMSSVQERNLSEAQKEILRSTRENELELLEKQIEDIQFLLAIHVNQLLDNLNYTQTLYSKFQENFKSAAPIWSRNVKALNKEIVLNHFKWELLRERLLLYIRQAIDEFVLVAEYYNTCRSTFMHKSTTIFKALNETLSTVNQKKQWLSQEERINCNYFIRINQFCAECKLSTTEFKNIITQDLNEQQKKHEIRMSHNLEKQLSHSAFPKGPKKDIDEDDDDDEDDNDDDNNDDRDDDGDNDDDDDDNNNEGTKERKFNTMSKSEALKQFKHLYEPYRDGILRKKRGVKGIVNAEYIVWDHLHNDIEAYAKNRWHLGSIDLKTLCIYKRPAKRRLPKF